MTHSGPRRVLLGLRFACEFTERVAEEATWRGYFSQAYAAFSDGSKKPLVFYTPERLIGTFDSEAKAGRPFLAERGLVLVDEVTRERMEQALQALADEGFFDEV